MHFSPAGESFSRHDRALDRERRAQSSCIEPRLDLPANEKGETLSCRRGFRLCIQRRLICRPLRKGNPVTSSGDG